MLLPCALFLASTLLVKQRTRSNIKIRKVRSEANLTTLSISDISKSVNKDIEALVRDLSLSAPCSLPPLTSVTLVGGGFRTISYHGAITVFLHRKVIDGNTKFYGASLGALWCVLCVLRTAPNSDQYDDLCVSIMDTMCSYIAQTHYNWASTWGELHEVVRDALSNLPASTLPLFQDRCNISITYLFPYPHNHVVNSYSSIDDLINAVVSSMWIPFFTRGPPLLGFLKNLATLHANKWSIDGGFTDNCPRPSSRSRHVTVIDYVPVTQVFRPPTMGLGSKDRSCKSVETMFRMEWERGVSNTHARLEVYAEQIAKEREGKRGRRGTLVDMSSYAASGFWLPSHGRAVYVVKVAGRVLVKTVCDLLGLRWQHYITRI